MTRTQSSFLRQLQQAVIDVETVKSVSQFSPNQALGSRAATDIGNLERPRRRGAFLENAQDDVSNRYKTLAGRSGKTRFRIVIDESLIAAMVPG